MVSSDSVTPTFGARSPAPGRLHTAGRWRAILAADAMTVMELATASQKREK